MARLRPRRWRLRTRLTLFFGMGALAVSTVLATTTWVALRETLVSEREAVAVDRLSTRARTVSRTLQGPEPDVAALLDSLGTPEGSRQVLVWKGDDFSTGIELGDALPAELRQRVLGDQTAARMRFAGETSTLLAVGLPLPAADAAYFLVSPLDEVEAALRTVAIVLVATAALTTVAGTAVGAWGARRALRPLSTAAGAAEAIAEGALDTRLPPPDDPDLARLATSFNGMARALQERIERDARFASDVSHELRSPLMTLAASVEVLQSRRDEMPERARSALDLLTADVTRFRVLVEDLLEISRYDAGAVRLDVEEVALADLVRRAVEMGPPPLPEVVVHPEVAGTLVLADQRRLVRVLANILDNARQHGGGATRVEVLPAGAEVQVAVEDAGPGVPAPERELVFERFARGGQTAGRRGVGEGVGLGLALVAEHVNLLGGEVWVEDRPDGGAGARFVVQLPVAVMLSEVEV